MKIFVSFLFMLTIIEASSAEEWKPTWSPIVIPSIDAVTFFGRHHSIQDDGQLIVWIHISHTSLKPAKYIQNKKYLAELQEWVLNCNEKKGTVATIRYTNSTDPDDLKEFALVHPSGKEQPTKKQVEVVCELIT